MNLLRVATSRFGYAFYRMDPFARLEWLENSEVWNDSTRASWILARLNKTIQFARERVPFYREYWGDHRVAETPLKSVSELPRFPILHKKTFRENSKRLTPSNVDQIRYVKKHTGGSTSIPVKYLLDIEQWEVMEAFHMYSWKKMGYTYGDQVGVIAGGSLVPERMTVKARLRNFATGRLFLYGVAMDGDLARQYHGKLTKFGAQFLYGYPSILYLFAKHLQEQGLKLPLKAVVTTAEMLLPHYRKCIQDWLGCPVFNNLGSNDGGFESYECPCHDGFHYNDLQAILETENAGTGDQNGRLLITNLWNRSTPFIRYENGDLASLTSEPCTCGSKFPRIASIQGRTTDILTFSNGRSLSGPALTLIFGPMNIDGWQIVQTAPDHVEVRICTQSESVPENYAVEIRRVMEHHLGAGVNLKIEPVRQLQLTSGGKLKPIWSEVT